MGGDDPQQAAMFSYISPEERVPPEHPLQSMQMIVDAMLKELSPRFALLCCHIGRPSIAQEPWLHALLWQVLYTIRSERLFMEQLDYNRLLRRFVGLNMDDPMWAPSTFSKNCARWLERDVAHAFFEQVLAQAVSKVAKSHNVGSLAVIVGPSLSFLARNVGSKTSLFAGPGAAVCRPLHVALFDQCFQRHVDEVGRVVHRLGGPSHRLDDQSSRGLPPCRHVQIRGDGLMMTIEGPWLLIR